MYLDETVSYGPATPQQVYGLLTDQGFREQVCEAFHCLSHRVTVEASDERATVTIVRVLPAQVPDFVRKFVGETIEVTQTERWGGADPADGSRTADVTVTISGQPARMEGVHTLTTAGEQAQLRLTGDLSVRVPFVGKKIEPEIAKAVVAALRTEAAMGVERLEH